MRNKKGASSKNVCGEVERSHQKLAEEFLARLGPRDTRPRDGRTAQDLFSSAGQTYAGSPPSAPEPPEFDRRQYRADVLQRLQQRAETRGNDLGQCSVPGGRAVGILFATY